MHAFGVTPSQAQAFQTGNPARFRPPLGLTLASLEVPFKLQSPWSVGQNRLGRPVLKALCAFTVGGVGVGRAGEIGDGQGRVGGNRDLQGSMNRFEELSGF